MLLTVCSDLHRGKPGHPADDATPGWAEAWATVPEPKLRLGDMDELWQFTRNEIGELAGTDVDGNHDWGSCGRGEIVIEGARGRTILLHGHQFDPWWARLLGRPAASVARVLECIWPDADVRLADWGRRALELGRYGETARYVRKAARYAARRGARQIVFGHLHRRVDSVYTIPFKRWLRLGRRVAAVRVVCTGCCCDGFRDFVEVEV
jgi:predicted phosphodiesterase